MRALRHPRRDCPEPAAIFRCRVVQMAALLTHLPALENILLVL
jgi:hypothetical protein